MEYEHIVHHVFNSLIRKNLETFGVDETEYQYFFENIISKFNLSDSDEIIENKSASKLDNELLLSLKDKDLYSYKIM